MIINVLAGNEHLIYLGDIEIKENLITKINFNFKNPNIAEVFAEAQPKFIKISKKANYQFEIKKISKFDFPSQKANKNYFIISDFLNDELPNKFSKYNLSIKLNFYQVLIIKWAKKQTLLHEINPRKKFFEYLIVGIPLLIVGFLIRGCYENNLEEKSKKIEQISNKKTFANNGSSPISGSVRKKIINLTNKPILSRQIRVPYSANWR